MPAYNEAANLESTYRATAQVLDSLEGYRWDMTIVDDGSTDNTAEVLQRLRDADQRVGSVSLSRNFGKEIALLAAMDHLEDADAVVIMDADGQHTPQVVPEMISWWEQGYDDVYAMRRDRRSDSALRRWLSKGYYGMLRRMSDTEVLPGSGDFRLLDRRCVAAIRQCRESNRYTKGLYSWIGFKKKGIDYSPEERAGGKSTFSYGRLFKLACDGITSSSTMPLRLASVSGGIVSALAFVYMAYIILKTMLYGEPVQGFPTLICVILFMGGIQLLCIGLIGEYVGRIFIETKRRPPYIVDRINGKKEEAR